MSHRLSIQLALHHARWLRGAIAKRVNRAEFHHHSHQGLIYSHPLIRYDVSTGEAVTAGLAEGSLLLRGMPRLESIQLGLDCYPVLARSIETRRLALGPAPDVIAYEFLTPYLALNQDNFVAWERSGPADRRRLLERVVVGNLLSLSKAIGLHVEDRLRAEIELEPDGWHELKPGVRLLGFRGTFWVNFTLPDRWGIGKSSARGFGTLIRRER